jgi:hypothetical protein
MIDSETSCEVTADWGVAEWAAMTTDGEVAAVAGYAKMQG